MSRRHAQPAGAPTRSRRDPLQRPVQIRVVGQRSICSAGQGRVGSAISGCFMPQIIFSNAAPITIFPSENRGLPPTGRRSRLTQKDSDRPTIARILPGFLAIVKITTKAHTSQATNPKNPISQSKPRQHLLCDSSRCGTEASGQSRRATVNSFRAATTSK